MALIRHTHGLRNTTRLQSHVDSNLYAGAHFDRFAFGDREPSLFDDDAVIADRKVGRVYKPSSFVARSRVLFVSIRMTWTFAPGMTALL
jgi:hypothetical protein